MNPGADKLPHWVMGVAPVILITLILLGGFWLQRLEKKARELERQRGTDDPGRA